MWFYTRKNTKVVVQFGPGIKIYQYYDTRNKGEKQLVENGLYYSLRFYGDPIGLMQDISFHVGMGEDSPKTIVRTLVETKDPKLEKRLKKFRAYCKEYGIRLIELEYSHPYKTPSKKKRKK